MPKRTHILIPRAPKLARCSSPMKPFIWQIRPKTTMVTSRSLTWNIPAGRTCTCLSLTHDCLLNSSQIGHEDCRIDHFNDVDFIVIFFALYSSGSILIMSDSGEIELLYLVRLAVRIKKEWQIIPRSQRNWPDALHVVEMYRNLSS